MALRFTPASSQYLTAPAPITAMPFAVGLWFRLVDDANVKTLWSLSDTATTNNYWRVRASSTEFIGLGAAAGGTEDQTTLDPVAPDTWAHVIARFITATNRRISCLEFDGSFNVLNDTTSRSPTGIDTVTLGARQTSAGAAEFWNGDLAEYWLTKADLYRSDADLTREMHHQIAFGGPFSWQPIVHNLVDYRSLMSHVASRTDALGELFPPIGRVEWSANGGPDRADHPPLPYWHERPAQHRRALVL